MPLMRISKVLAAPAILITGVLVLSACSSSSGSTDETSAPPAEATELSGSSWVLQSYATADRADVPADTSADVATLVFAADGTFAGSTGCNRIAGTYTQSGTALTFQVGPMTKRACPGAVADQESAIVAALPVIASFTSTDGLALQDASGAALLTYTPGLSTLAGTSWQATGVNNGKEAVVSQAGIEKATATFGDDGTISGSGGCNNFNGPYATSGTDAITIGPLAATAMACPEPAMQIEQQYFAALQNAKVYQIEGDTLTLRDSQGATQVTFTLTK